MIRFIVALLLISLGGCASTTRSIIATAPLPTGASLHYRELGDPADPPLILIHGYSDSWRSYNLVIDDLASTNHVYAITLRGHGDSSRPATGYTMAHFARDVVAFMDAMGLESAAVVGHSMGSFVSMELALAAPQRVSALVLTGTGAHVQNPDIQEFTDYLTSLQDPVPAEFVREFQESTMHHPAPREFVDGAIAESLKMPASVWRQAAEGMDQVDFTSRLTRIAAPTLIIQGEHDSIFDPEAKSAPARLIPNATEITYEETGHAPHWERPQQFARDVLQFLKRVRSETTT